ncbi:hypothetical protein BH09SUM1_BH09SUM1_19510 [soil metagenome]
MDSEEYYEGARKGFGVLFQAALYDSVDRIREGPLRWQVHIYGTRRFVMLKFPYNIIYRVNDDDSVDIIAFAHQKRKPDYWRRRLHDPIL